MTLQELNRSDLSDRIFSCYEFMKFRDEEATKTMFYQTELSVGSVWTMLPGQTLPIHSHEKADDIWIVLEGEAEYYPECGQKVLIKKGDIVVARPGEKHGMTNHTEMPFVMLGIAGPIPIGFIPHELHAVEEVAT